MKNKFVAQNYTNSIGQELVPGDKVVFVSTGYSHNVYTNTGIYEGVTVDSNGKVTAIRVGQIEKRRWNYDYKTGKGGYEDYVGATSLPRKRVFKIV